MSRMYDSRFNFAVAEVRYLGSKNFLQLEGGEEHGAQPSLFSPEIHTRARVDG